MAPLLPVYKAEHPVPGRYIITLNDGVSLAAHLKYTRASIASNISKTTEKEKKSKSSSHITHEFNLINGYAGKFTNDDLNDLRARLDIASIEQDSIGWLCDETIQTDAPWGLGRISSEEKLTGNDHDLKFEYKYDSTAGKGVSIYVFDTGIDVNHPAFEGRASWGKTFGPWEDKDKDGHGTHCAGIAISGPYGVAKASKVIAVKVMNGRNDGTASQFIASTEWVAKRAARTGAPSVASMSLSFGPCIGVDRAVKDLSQRGVTVVVGAGNNNKDASGFSPARVKEAITVAASNIHDRKAEFSNYGTPVTIWAPGVNIISTWPDGKTKICSGTSMATPHVAGFAAYLLGRDTSLTPTKITRTIKNKACYLVLSGVPAGTSNRLLNNSS